MRLIFLLLGILSNACTGYITSSLLRSGLTASVSSSSSIRAGTCTAITFALSDTTPQGVDTELSVSGLGTAQLYADAACSQALSSPSILAGSSQRVAYFKGTVAGTLNLLITTARGGQSSTKLTVTADVADHLEYVSGNAQSAALGGLLGQALKVKVVDRYGNAVSGHSVLFSSTYGEVFRSPLLATSGADGVASSSIRLRFNRIKYPILVRGLTTLPDAAGSGNSTLQFNATAQSAGNGAIGAQLPRGLFTGAPSPTVADINGDGVNDILAPYSVSGGTLQVARGNGDFTFQATQDFTIGIGAASALVVEDFNLDGKLDVVFANGGQGIGVFINNGAVGSGPVSFEAPVFYSTGGAIYSRDIKAADMNGDGYLDLVSAGDFNNRIYIHTGNASGTFTYFGDYATAGHSPSYVEIADFNGDSRPDVLSTQSGGTTMKLLLNNGSGGLSAPSDLVVASQAYRGIPGDFNNDNHIDVVVPCYVAANNVALFLNNGSGGFTGPTYFAAGAFSMNGEVGDFNGDQNLDVAVANYSARTYQILLGNGAGGFPTITSYTASTGFDLARMGSGDFNHDNKLDLWVAGGAGGGGNIGPGN